MRKRTILEKKRSLKDRDRLRLTYKWPWEGEQEEIELPLKLLVIGDFTQRPEDSRLEERKTIKIDKDNFNEVMAIHKLSLTIQVENYLSVAEMSDLDVNLKFSSLSDFEPDSILNQVPELKEFIKPFYGHKTKEEALNVFCKQLDAILHHPDFQQLEAAWRGLKFLVNQTDFREDIKIELLNCSKEDLFEDFEDNLKITKSGIFQTVYYPYAVLGGEPYGAIIANYQFVRFSRQDIRLLQYIASVAAMSHCPFIASAGPKFFGIDDFNDLPKVKDLTGLFNGINYKRWEYFSNKWQSFRESDDVRYVALAMPRFLLRPPYESNNNPVKEFNYNESVSGSHEHYLWGNAAFAFATNLTKSFAKYRWCGDIIGPKAGGNIEGLSVHQFDSMEGTQTKGPTEVYISDRREYELSEEGFMALTMRKNSDVACFFSANSVQKPINFPDTLEGREAFLSYKLVAQLPYLFFITRFAHYIKVLYKMNMGMWRDNKDLAQNELNHWIRQYVTDADIRYKPLRNAQIILDEGEYEGHSCRFLLKVIPNFKYYGAVFNLSLVGILG